jgi:predicted ATPase
MYNFESRVTTGGPRMIRQAFLSLFQLRFEDGPYLLDEPEAALSPQRQLAFLRILHELTAQKIAQFVIATHSPMLLTFPNATIWRCPVMRRNEGDSWVTAATGRDVTNPESADPTEGRQTRDRPRDMTSTQRDHHRQFAAI